MSIVEPEKLIILISDLEELLSSWNIAASDAYTLTEKLKREGIEVNNLAEKDRNRALETAEVDSHEVERLRKDSESLYDKSQELSQQTFRLSDLADERFRKWKEAHIVSNQHVQESDEWLKTANNEFRRAKYELDDAEEDYNKQEYRYNAALSTLNSTPEYYEIEKTDLKGRPYKEHGYNPAHESAKYQVGVEEEKLREKKRILKEKKDNYEQAVDQIRHAKHAARLAQDMQSTSKRNLEKSLILKEWADNAERSASYAFSAIESAQKFVSDAELFIDQQSDLNENIVREYVRLRKILDEVVIVVQNINEQTSECTIYSVDFANSLYGKRTLLHKLAAIIPDKVSPFKTY